jgi:hypothetical protein
MFASLLLAASLSAAVPAGDRVVCPSQRASHGAVPARWFEPEPPEPDSPPSLAFAPTTATDGIVFPMAGARWFPQYDAGRNGGIYAFYDTTSHALYECGYAGPTRVLIAWTSPESWVARTVPAFAAHVHWASTHGITFGTSLARVEHVYGGERPQASGKLLYLGYVKHDALADGNEFATHTTFLFEAGKLVGVERYTGS